MYGEPQYLRVMAMRIAAMRVCIRRPESGIPHIPDDIYSLIMGVYVAEFKIAEAIPPSLTNNGESFWLEDRGYDLPKYIRTNVIRWTRRDYGLPNMVYTDGILTWDYDGIDKSYYPANQIIVILSRKKIGEAQTIFLDKPFEFKIDFFL